MPIEKWRIWKDSGQHPERLTPLLDACKPHIDREVNRWSSSGLPRIVLEAEAKRLAVESFHTFKPGAGAQITTHMTNHLRGLDRFVNTYREDIRLPQEKVHLANKVFRTKQELELELGREATIEEISEHSGVGKHTIGSLKRFQSSLYSNNEMGGFAQPVREDITHDQIVADFLYHDLSPKQKIVFQHSTGYRGKPVMSAGEIAKKLNVSAPRVSAIKNEIADKARRYQTAVNSLMS